MNNQIKPANGKLGVLCIGVGGAVASTFIIGTLMARKGLSEPIGSLTQLGRMRVGQGKEAKKMQISEVVSLASLSDIQFGGWDIFPENVYEAALHAEVLKERDINPVKAELEAIIPMKGAFDQDFVKRLQGTHVKQAVTRWELTEQLRADIREFKKNNDCQRIVVIWCASTEIYIEQSAPHKSLAALEAAMKADEKEAIAPCMCYAYAAIAEGAPFIMGAPNLCVEIPALVEFAKKQGTPIVGKDFKTGQTMMKTVLAPMLRTRMLGLRGWFSTNILGNRDGEVLDDPAAFKTKEVSKLSVIENILDKKEFPNLYSDVFHKVRINYYPPRKDNKESWDNLDIIGWMGYPMELKVNFLCRDSILAAPLCLDLVIFSDLAARAGLSGIQTWLGFYSKSPIQENGDEPVHDLFEQFAIMKNTLRTLGGYPADGAID